MPFYNDRQYCHLGAMARLKRFCLFQVISRLAGSVICVFSAIYLYSTARFSLLEIVLFYCAFGISYVFLAPLGAKFAARHGVKKSMLISIPLHLMYLGGYHLLVEYPILLFAVAVLLAVFSMFYWPALHIDYAHVLVRGHEGRELGFIYSSMTLISVVGITLGGFLYSNYGAWAMLAAAGILFIASAVPLAFTKDIHEPFSMRYKELVLYCCAPGSWHKNIVWAAHGAQMSVLTVFWPLYIYVVLESIWSVAWLTALTIFVTMLAMMLFGKLADRWSRWATLRIAALVSFVLWFFRIFVFNPFSIAVVDAVGRTATGAMQVSIQTIVYKRARRKDQASFLMRREIFHNIGKVFILLLSAGLLAALGETHFFLVFVLAAAACLGYFFIY